MEEGTYPDDTDFASVPVQRQAKRGTDLWPFYKQLVGEMMKRSQRAYHTIVQKLDSGGHSAYVQLWPFIIGTLLRQGEERARCVEGESVVQAQVLLAQLLCRYDIDANLCLMWINRIYALIANSKTPDTLKVTLLEYLATSQNASDRLRIIPFLTQLMASESNDKARACAILGLNLLREHCSHQLFAGTFQVVSQMWEAAPKKTIAGNGPPLGVLSKFALALLALRRLKIPPVAALEHAVAVLTDEAEVAATWKRCAPSTGDRLLAAIVNVYGTSALKHQDEPFVYSLHRALLHVVKRELDQRVSLLRVVVDAMSGRSADSEVALRRLTAVLVPALMPEPMPDGTYMEELHEASEVIAVFRKLATDPRLGRAWSHLRNSEQWARTGLPVTQADMLQFVSTEVPPHLAGRKWLPALAGLERETGDCPLSVYENRFYDGVSAEPLNQLVPWIVHLLAYECVSNKDRLIELLTEIACDGLAKRYTLGGWDLTSEHVCYDVVGKDSAVQLQTLSLISMYPGLWRTTLPFLVATFYDVTHPVAVRAAALAAMTYVTPMPDESHDGDGEADDKVNAFEQVLRLLGLFLLCPGMSLKSMVARAFAEGRACALSTEQMTQLPEELRTLLMSMGACTSTIEAPPAPFHRFQIAAAEGTCRLIFRARGWTQHVNQLQWAKRSQPVEPSACEVRLHPLLPNALLALTRADEHAIYIYDLLRSTPQATQAKIQRLLCPEPEDPPAPRAWSAAQVPLEAAGEGEEDDQVWEPLSDAESEADDYEEELL